MADYQKASKQALFSALSHDDDVLRQKIETLNRYMMKKNIDKQMQARVRKYLEYVIETQRMHKNQDEVVLSMLSTNLREELLNQVNGKVLKENQLFSSKFSSKFIVELSGFLVEHVYSPEEIIFKVTSSG